MSEKSRTALRTVVVLAGVTAGSTAAPAVAAPPDSSFWTAEDPSTLEMLFLLGALPLAVIAVIALLTYLPSIMRRGSESKDLVWQERSEWFGGPRGGVDQLEQSGAGSTTGSHAAPGSATGSEAGTDSGTGGSGARW